MGSNFPVRNESMKEIIYEINHILNCGCEIKLSYDLSGCCKINEMDS